MSQEWNELVEISTMATENASVVSMVTLSEGDLNLQYEGFYKASQFITGIVLYPIICIVGLIGNCINLLVFSRKNMVTSTNVFLMALAIADMIKLINDALYTINLILSRSHPDAANKMMGHVYPISHYIFNEAVCVSSWLTVSVAVERYISVCHATYAKQWCTIHKARIVSALVFISMSLIAVPSAFRYTSVIRTPNNATNASYYEVILSKLGQNVEFMTIYTWIQNLLRSLIPLFVLIILNTCIIHALRKQRIPGKKLSARNRITLMLIVIILIFLICITPDAIMSTCFGFGYVDENNLVKGIREFTDMLLGVNCATSFFVYISFSKVFRNTFMTLFCPAIKTEQQRSPRSRFTEQPTTHANDHLLPSNNNCFTFNTSTSNIALNCPLTADEQTFV